MGYKKLVVMGVAAGLVTGLAACGSGNSYSGASASRVVTGAITAFGSVYVKGEKFETDSASVYVEDSQASESDLRVGMTVSVKSSTAGVADSIHFDDDVEGVVTSTAIAADNTGTLDVMGQTVAVDSKTIFESHVAGITSASGIVAGNIVEVSGSSSGTGSITATRLEVKAVDLASYVAAGHSLEVKGIVGSHADGSKTFDIGSMTVDYSGAIIDDSMPAGSWDGLYVEVKSTAGIVADQLVASKVELEDGGTKGVHDDDDEVEVKGKVSALVAGTSVTVNGQTFLLDANTEYEHGVAADLAVGVMVEVEGFVNGSGDLVAKEVEFEDHDADSELEAKGVVTNITLIATNEGTVEVDGLLTITVNNKTIMHDDSATPVTNFNLSLLNVGDTVDVEYVDVSGVKTATKLEREMMVAP